MKRLVALLLCLVTSISLLVGCGGKEKEKEAGDWDGKITIGLPDNSLVQDFETNKLTLWLEEQTGYDLEFYVFAATGADSKSQLATMVAGGENNLLIFLCHTNMISDPENTHHLRNL